MTLAVFRFNESKTWEIHIEPDHPNVYQVPSYRRHEAHRKPGAVGALEVPELGQEHGLSFL